MVPVAGAEAYDRYLVAGRDAVLVQDAGDEFLHGGLRIGTALTVHTVRAVDAQYDMGWTDRLDLHQVGGGDGHSHVEVVAAGMSGCFMDGDHAVLGCNKGALLHDLAVLRSGVSKNREFQAAQEHAQE